MKARQYAEALHLAAADKDDAALQELLERFRVLLRERGHTRLTPAILRELEKLEAQRQDPNIVHVAVAQKQDTQAFASEIQEDIAALDAAGQTQDVVVDETLIGGYEVRTGGGRIDRTYKRALLTLYNTLRTNA
jgi:F0F1-type ATP synthase delta subunit